MTSLRAAAVLALLALVSVHLGLPWNGEGGDLLGLLSREDILGALPDWQAVSDAYQPCPEAVERLKAVAGTVEIKVFLGTWCPDSKAHVSELFKVLDVVDNPRLNVSYIGVPRDKALRAEYYQGRNIERLPTFLVFVGGLEKGRIIEIPTVSIENDLADILDR
ncbi:MAG: thioredoxin family protein [Candidatus Aminicenantes bacterium]|nr:thioredoxin family protein [Candidatus Aminicenantes bacterium]